MHKPEATNGEGCLFIEQKIVTVFIFMYQKEDYDNCDNPENATYQIMKNHSIKIKTL